MDKKQITARFQPQAWINDYAINVDPEGETEFDVTQEILAMGREAALGLEDDTWDTDDLRSCESAPQWIQDWSGPFYIEVSEAIREYFDAG